ncbi:MAG: ribosomal protein S18 acetylase RimI-like enzyme [Crocinitomix sp.]|jgi:ribosomal protein S18 acetylase RimI-like enzyme
MKIKKAIALDTELIFLLLKSVAAHMREQGIMQWNDNYPTIEHVIADIVAENVYLGMEDDTLLGVISIDANQSPEYAEIPWQYTDGKVLVVHRLAVSPTAQKKGVGRQLMDFALNKAIEEGYSSIRLDAYSQNQRTLSFYEKRGYEKRGEIYFPYREESFNCYEKNVRMGIGN